jgi:hypothetical protein
VARDLVARSVEQAGCGVLVVEPVGTVVEEVAVLVAPALLVLAAAAGTRSGAGDGDGGVPVLPI